MRSIQELSQVSYKEVTPKEWLLLENEGIINDCGGAGNDIKNRIIRWFLKNLLKILKGVFIEASCKIHDFSYWKGGNEYDRYVADFGFFKKIIADISEKNGFFTVVGYTTVALVFYGFVRIGGKSYFNYK